MIHSTLVKRNFSSLLAFENFAFEWASICYKLNKSDRNKKRG